jgi:hypothetical protein
MELELTLTVIANDGNPSQLKDNTREALRLVEYILCNHGSDKHICRVYKELQANGDPDHIDYTIEDSGSLWVAKAVLSA